LNELEFRVPVAASRGQLALTAARLADAFRSHPSTELPRTYADRVSRLAFPTLNGFLKGYIDLVFEHDGRFYVVDYKTSHLGDTLSDYSFPRMQAEMAESHYFLQYHLYTLAVHRLLARFQRGYDYERGFGGVLYLFLKGMRPGSPHGIFYEKPPLSRLEALGRALQGDA
jgi:exodeoxyribonuclease V beta subunit